MARFRRHHGDPHLAEMGVLLQLGAGAAIDVGAFEFVGTQKSVTAFWSNLLTESVAKSDFE